MEPNSCELAEFLDGVHFHSKLDWYPKLLLYPVPSVTAVDLGFQEQLVEEPKIAVEVGKIVGKEAAII